MGVEHKRRRAGAGAGAGAGTGGGSVPDLEEAVPAAGGDGHAVLAHAQARDAVVVPGEHACAHHTRTQPSTPLDLRACIHCICIHSGQRQLEPKRQSMSERTEYEGVSKSFSL